MQQPPGNGTTAVLGNAYHAARTPGSTNSCAPPPAHAATFGPSNFGVHDDAAVYVPARRRAVGAPECHVLEPLAVARRKSVEGAPAMNFQLTLHTRSFIRWTSHGDNRWSSSSRVVNITARVGASGK